MFLSSPSRNFPLTHMILFHRTLNKVRSLKYLDIFGLLTGSGLEQLECSLPHVTFNKYHHSSVARPTIHPRRTSIWGIRTRDWETSLLVKFFSFSCRNKANKIIANIFDNQLDVAYWKSYCALLNVPALMFLKSLGMLNPIFHKKISPFGWKELEAWKINHRGSSA